jgi:hypothetical protein
LEYSQASSILNRHIFEGDKASLLTNVANNPERFIGLFRPTKPKAKILQNLLQSHEIRFGDAIEELLKEMLRDLGFTILPSQFVNSNRERLSLDQYFTDGSIYYFVEQKVRDDHDSTKKRGQIRNFESKLEILTALHPGQLLGMMYFVDPDLEKNKNYYRQELNNLSGFYNLPIHLYYGPEFFTHFGHPELWNDLISWLKQWKDELPDLPEVDLDLDPAASYDEIKTLRISIWRRFITNDQLWEQGIPQVLFKRGATLEMILDNFRGRPSAPYRTLSDLLAIRLDQYDAG